MPIRALRLVRKMRGGAQAHLLEADDGRFYVVKFRNNPQHRRVLINEWIASVFLQAVADFNAATTSFIEITPQFLASEREVYMQVGSRRLDVAPGWHFGSQFPGDPKLVPVFDFLPDSLLHQCVNLRDYLGALVFDKWVSNADGRQSIFYKARIRDSRESGTGEAFEKGFVTQMMDNGFIFDGPNWRYGDSPIQGHYFRAKVYSAATTSRGLSTMARPDTIFSRRKSMRRCTQSASRFRGIGRCDGDALGFSCSSMGCSHAVQRVGDLIDVSAPRKV